MNEKEQNLLNSILQVVSGKKEQIDETQKLQHLPWRPLTKTISKKTISEINKTFILIDKLIKEFKKREDEDLKHLGLKGSKIETHIESLKNDVEGTFDRNDSFGPNLYSLHALVEHFAMLEGDMRVYAKNTRQKSETLTEMQKELEKAKKLLHNSYMQQR